MSVELSFEIAGDDPTVLLDLQKSIPDAEVEFASGLGGLEMLGTLVIPSIALVVQLVTAIRDAKEKNPTIHIHQVHIHNGDQYITVLAKEHDNVEEAIRTAAKRLGSGD